MEALARRTAKLPPIELGEPLGEPGGVIGKTTHASLQSGIVYGFAGAVDAIARRVQRELGDQTDFVATGGHAAAIIPFCEMIDEVDDLLTLTGLRLDLPEEPLTQPPLTAPFRIGDVTVANRVLLAPLAGIGNWFVRLQARRHGAGLAVSEMVSSFGLHHRNERTIRELLRIHPGGAPGLDPAVRPRSRGDALGRRDRRRRRRRPDRHQHGLPGAEDPRGRRRRGALAAARARRPARTGRSRGLRAAGHREASLRDRPR